MRNLRDVAAWMAQQSQAVRLVFWVSRRAKCRRDVPALSTRRPAPCRRIRASKVVRNRLVRAVHADRRQGNAMTDASQVVTIPKADFEALVEALRSAFGRCRYDMGSDNEQGPIGCQLDDIFGVGQGSSCHCRAAAAALAKIAAP